MVSQRCKILVRNELNKLNICDTIVNLGVIELVQDITPSQQAELKSNLKKYGLELLDDKRSDLVERIKQVIIELVHSDDESKKLNYSNCISTKLGYDYSYLANVFAEVKGITITQFIIITKIERVKELIIYDQLSLSEIAFQLNYSSAAHLSNQFKKITGLTPSFYKTVADKRLSNP